MKKLLSVVLAGVMLLGMFGLGAGALIDDHTLQFELPVVTAIEAQWNGEILLGTGWFADDSNGDKQLLVPFFNPTNVDVTVHFDDGTYELLSAWWGGISSGHGWQEWDVQVWYNPRSNVVTARYGDSRIREAALEEAGCCCYVDWGAVEASLPQTTVDFPENYLELFMAEQAPVHALTYQVELSEPFTGMRVFSFTAPYTKSYRVEFPQGWGSGVFVTNEDFEVITTSRWTIPLEAGETYYIFLSASDDTTVVVTESTSSQPWQPTLLDRWLDWTSNMAGRLDNNVFGRILLVLIFPILFVITLVVAPISWIIHGW
ncbi:MAG: hypothetical protein FWB76_03555 [Oscillospiraceae bacterium]|nr:hypothetical protein [Oscillospiraceae bacterium]